MFDFIYIPFAYLMKFCLIISGNLYFFALFFFALIMQIVLFPLAIKQQKSQILMASLKPKELAIKKKYAGRTDKPTQQKMQQELQQMQQDNGYSAFSGCLPMVVQLVLIFILYAIVRQPVSFAKVDVLDNYKYSDESSIVDKQGQELKGIEQMYYGSVDVIEQIRQGFISKNPAVEGEANDKADDTSETSATESGETGIVFEAISEEQNAALANFATADGKGGYLLVFKGQATDEKYSNGLTKYKYNLEAKSNGYPETALVQFMRDYNNYVEEFKEKGWLASDFELTDNAKKLSENVEHLPEFKIFGIDLLQTPSFNGNYILLLIPILVFATSVLLGKITRKFSVQTTGPDGKPVGGGLFMEWGLPAMSLVFSFMFPASIGVYWIWRTGVSMVQPLVLNKLYPLPNVSKEAIEKAEQELKDSLKAKKKKIITIEVDADDDTYKDLEVSAPVNTQPQQQKKSGGQQKKLSDTDAAYRKPKTVELLSSDDDEEADAPAENGEDEKK